MLYNQETPKDISTSKSCVILTFIFTICKARSYLLPIIRKLELNKTKQEIINYGCHKSFQIYIQFLHVHFYFILLCA